MIQQVSVTDLIRNFSDYVNRVAYRGERFLLVRGGVNVAELGPVPGGRRLGELGALLDSLPRLGEEDAGALAAELERARSELETQVDPWDF